MLRDRSQLLAFLLSLVVASSLILLFFGMDDDRGAFAFLHYPTVIAQLAFIAAVFQRAEERQQLATLTPVQRFLMAGFFVYIPLTSLLSPIPTALFLSQFWLVHVLFFVALIGYFRAHISTQNDVIWIVLGLTVLIHVIAFLVAWAIWPELVIISVMPAFENIRFLGYFASPAAAVMAIWYLHRNGGATLSLLCYLGAAFYIIYTGSRGGAVAVVGGLCIGGLYLALTRQQIHVARLAVLIALTGLLLVISMYLPRLPWVPLLDRAEVVLDQSTSRSLSGRKELWADVSAVIQQRWLLGYGPSYVSHIFSAMLDPAALAFTEPNIRNPHNSVLQALLHWGAAGTVLLLALLAAFAGDLWRGLKDYPERALLPFTVIATMLVHSLVSGVFFYPYSTVIGIIAFAWLVSLRPFPQSTR